MSSHIIKNKCPKCNKLMEVRGHANITKKILEKEYYFEEWHYCKECKHVQHYEQYKVFNN